MRPFRQALLTAIFCMLYVSPVRADVVEIQRLDFGTWAIGDNSTVRDIMVAPNGAYSASPGPIMLHAPQQGIYDIGGLTPSVSVNSIDVMQSSPLSLGADTFDMDAFQTSSSGSTDGNGRITINVGATAHTSGNGTGYEDGVYTGHLDLDVNLNF